MSSWPRASRRRRTVPQFHSRLRTSRSTRSTYRHSPSITESASASRGMRLAHTCTDCGRSGFGHVRRKPRDGCSCSCRNPVLEGAISTIRDCVLLCCTAEYLGGDTLELAHERVVHVLLLADIGLEPLPLDNLRTTTRVSGKSASKKARQLLDVPHGCAWKDVNITIHRTGAVTIRVRREERRLSLRELGLRGRNNSTASLLFLDLCSVATKQRWEPDDVRGRTGEKRLERLKKLLRSWVVVRGDPFVKHGRQVLPGFGISLDGGTPRSAGRKPEDEEEPADDRHVDYEELSGFSITSDKRVHD